MPDIAYKPQEKLKKIYSGGTLDPPKFMPTFIEWLRTKGLRVIKNKLSTGTIYEVPEGKVLFITSIFITSLDSLNYGQTYVYLTDENVDTLLVANAFPTGSGNNSITFSPPLGILEKEKLIVGRSNASTNATAGFTGFLVAAKDIPNF